MLSRQPCVFHRNGQISALYAALYLRQPQLFKWSGLAAIASRHIRLALWPLRLGADPSDAIDLPKALGRAPAGTASAHRRPTVAQLSSIVKHASTPVERSLQTTQIYEGTNQIQRIVIAKKLFS